MISNNFQIFIELGLGPLNPKDRQVQYIKNSFLIFTFYDTNVNNVKTVTNKANKLHSQYKIRNQEIRRPGQNREHLGARNLNLILRLLGKLKESCGRGKRNYRIAL